MSLSKLVSFPRVTFEVEGTLTLHKAILHMADALSASRDKLLNYTANFHSPLEIMHSFKIFLFNLKELLLMETSMFL